MSRQTSPSRHGWLIAVLLVWTTATTANENVNVWDGQLRLLPSDRWTSLGLDQPEFRDGASQSEGAWILPISQRGALTLEARHGSLQSIAGGALQLDGQLHWQLAGQALQWQGLRLQAGSEHLQLVLADSAERIWLLLDHMHFELNPLADDLRFFNVDMRMGEAMAASLNRPELAGSHLGQAEILTRFQEAPVPTDDPDFCQPVRWPGTLIDPDHPEVGRYQADVQLIDLNGFTVNRCETDNSSCDGPGGIDAPMVISPSAELRNSNNPDTAAVPWFSKFSGVFSPYGNDQHPFLVWNIYRTDADGRLLQIGRSGVKHAFLTVNSACTSCPNTHPQNNFHILWPNCRDTYGTGNNDTNRHLGPRSEIAPNTVRWGRCGSTSDANCDGENDFPTTTMFENRTRLRESTLDLSMHPGAQFRFEGWYLVRDDINIYNTMGSRSFEPSYSNGWLLGNLGTYTQGPAIDHWVAPESSGLQARNRELVTTEGRLKAAVRVTEVEPGVFRYDYALANFTLAREITEGAEPNLRLLSNRGISSLRLLLDADADLTALRFHDGDDLESNDWTSQHQGDQLRFDMAEGNSLDWGSLYSFSFETNRAPLPGSLILGMAELGTPTQYELSLLVPTLGPDDIFRDGAEGEL